MARVGRQASADRPPQAAAAPWREGQRYLRQVHPAKGKPIAGRLVAFRLPADKASEARKRVRKEHGAKTSEEQLWMAQFVVFFTTVSNSKLTAGQIVELYRLRWQVELEWVRLHCGGMKSPDVAQFGEFFVGA